MVGHPRNSANSYSSSSRWNGLFTNASDCLRDLFGITVDRGLVLSAASLWRFREDDRVLPLLRKDSRLSEATTSIIAGCCLRKSSTLCRCSSDMPLHMLASGGMSTRMSSKSSTLVLPLLYNRRAVTMKPTTSFKMRYWIRAKTDR